MLPSKHFIMGTLPSETNAVCNTVVMCDEEKLKRNVEGEEEHFSDEPSKKEWNLDTIPTEVLLHICSFLDAKFIITTLSLVCRVLNNILLDDTTWKIRIKKRWMKRYPPLAVTDDQFNWKQACIEREEQYSLWCEEAERIQSFVLKNGHYSSVDAVHLTVDGRLCFSGSRDRSIIVWKVDQLDPNPNADNTKAIQQKILTAHQGWVWAMESHGDTFLSASWDTKVKVWQLGSELRELAALRCRVAALCLACSEDLIAVGAFDRKVLLFDPRSGFKQVSWYTRHKKPVLCLAMDDKYIISGSEDSTVNIWDRRANTTYKTIEIPNASFPLTLSLKHGLLYLGDKKGQLHLVDPTEGKFDIVQTYNIGHTGKLMGIHHSLGSIVTCSTDGSVRVLEPSLFPGVIRTINTGCDDLTGLDYKNRVLAVGSSNSLVHIWTPKNFPMSTS